MVNALEVAKKFHEVYELLAPSFGYETRTETRAFDAESPNGKLMIAVCQEVGDQIELSAFRADLDEREAPADGVKTGLDLVAEERERQVRKGFDANHDDQHCDQSLLHAAILLATNVCGLQLANVDPPSADGPWPDQLVLHAAKKYHDEPIRLLVIAAALIVAEIEAAQRENMDGSRKRQGIW